MMIKDNTPAEIPVDVVHATPRGRILAVTSIAIVISVIACFQLFVFPLIDSALRTDPPLKAVTTLKLIFTGCSLFGLVPALILIATGWKVLRYHQFPAPDAWVWRDTKIKRGNNAVWIGRLCVASGVLAGMLCIGLTIYAWIMFDRFVPEHKLPPGVVILKEPVIPKR